MMEKKTYRGGKRTESLVAVRGRWGVGGKSRQSVESSMAFHSMLHDENSAGSAEKRPLSASARLSAHEKRQVLPSMVYLSAFPGPCSLFIYKTREAHPLTAG
jgi:hypothetical protein